jgi:hypothetical protein
MSIQLINLRTPSFVRRERARTTTPAPPTTTDTAAPTDYAAHGLRRGSKAPLRLARGSGGARPPAVAPRMPAGAGMWHRLVPLTNMRTNRAACVVSGARDPMQSGRASWDRRRAILTPPPGSARAPAPLPAAAKPQRQVRARARDWLRTGSPAGMTWQALSASA